MNNKPDTQSDYTHITILLDRTGSMESIRNDIIDGFNDFLETQKEESTHATITLIQFDSVEPYQVVYAYQPIAAAPKLSRKNYIPRGNTPLFDAMGRGIIDLGKQLAAMKKKGCPDKVIFVVVTDGRENASLEFTKEEVRKLVKVKSEKWNWQFVFLSADLDAMQDGSAMGIDSASSLLFQKTAEGNKAAWRSLSERTVDYRAARRKKMDFDPEDRKHPNDPGKI